MRPIARNLYLVLAWLFVALLLVQVFLAGLGVFRSDADFPTHRDFGYLLELFPILLLVFGVLGGMDRRLAVIAAVVFGQFILQSVFVLQRGSAPMIAALHPVNGFLILLLAVVMARAAWMARAEAPQPA